MTLRKKWSMELMERQRSLGACSRCLLIESAAVRSCLTICKAGLQVWLAKSSFESLKKKIIKIVFNKHFQPPFGGLTWSLFNFVQEITIWRCLKPYLDKQIWDCYFKNQWYPQILGQKAHQTPDFILVTFHKKTHNFH